MKEDYINKIITLLDKADIPLLDFICKLLEKRINKITENCLTSD